MKLNITDNHGLPYKDKDKYEQQIAESHKKYKWFQRWSHQASLQELEDWWALVTTHTALEKMTAYHQMAIPKKWGELVFTLRGKDFRRENE